MSERVNTPSGLDAERRPDQKPASDRLESWKEIAAYLKRDLRTVQRWEKKEGLPVHRHLHDERASIFAFKAELDAWWQNEYLQLEIEEKQSPSPLAAIEQVPIARTTGANWFGRNRSRLAMAAATAVVIAAAVALPLVRYRHRTPALTERDTIVLADFTNKTGDPVFDDTLGQGLSVQLEQSPFLSIISDQQIQQTIKMMGQKSDAKLTPEIAQELCQRTGSAAVLDGSIAQVGTQYLLTVRAVNCSNGESLASTEAQASDKNHVLDALGKTASEIRSKLGESLSTVQKFDIPLEQATTPSLEALKVYSRGRQVLISANFSGAAQAFRQAVALDPNFAVAHASLGVSYYDLGENSAAAEEMRKAYALRSHVSGRERFYIEFHFYDGVLGDEEKARKVYELWAQTYPRDYIPLVGLSVICQHLGRYEKALDEIHKLLRVAPEYGGTYSKLFVSYLLLNRRDEAHATAKEAETKGASIWPLYLYLLAFLDNDGQGMARQLSRWDVGRGNEGLAQAFSTAATAGEWLTFGQARTTAYFGRLGNAESLYQQAAASAEGAEENETAATYVADSALQEALFGDAAKARRNAADALKRSRGRDVQYVAALAFAVAADRTRAQALSDDIDKRFPEDTMVQFNYLPTLRGQLALNRGDSASAIESLQAAAPYELGLMGGAAFSPALYPIYVRGEAYLLGHRGAQAATEFQKIIDHPGVVVNEPIGALAHLQIGRAYAMQGDTAKARAAYQDFLTLWKGADPDIPIDRQAKAEYAKLK